MDTINKDAIASTPAVKTDNEGRRQVFFLQLHQELFLPSVGQLSKQLDVSPSSQSKQRGLKMWLSELGVEVELRGRRAFVPFANIAFAVFSPTPTKAEAAQLDRGIPQGQAGNVSSKVGHATVTPKAG